MRVDTLMSLWYFPLFFHFMSTLISLDWDPGLKVYIYSRKIVYTISKLMSQYPRLTNTLIVCIFHCIYYFSNYLLVAFCVTNINKETS